MAATPRNEVTMSAHLSRPGEPQGSRAGSPVVKRRRAGSHRANRIASILFVLPLLLGLVLFVLAPLIATFVFSLQEYHALRGMTGFVGADNYERLIADPSFHRSLAATLGFVGMYVPVSVVFALMLAVLLNSKIPLRTFFRMAYFLPMVISLAAWSVAWNLILQDNGALNGILSSLGIPTANWLHDTSTALPAIVAISLFKEVGLAMLIFLAALQGVQPELLDAAQIDGAGWWRRLSSVVIPSISPAILMVVVLNIVGAFKIFDTIRITTQGGPQEATSVLAWYIFRQAFQLFDIGYGSAASVVLFLLLTLVTVAIWSVRKRVVHLED